MANISKLVATQNHSTVSNSSKIVEFSDYILNPVFKKSLKMKGINVVRMWLNIVTKQNI